MQLRLRFIVLHFSFHHRMFHLSGVACPVTTVRNIDPVPRRVMTHKTIVAAKLKYFLINIFILQRGQSLPVGGVFWNGENELNCTGSRNAQCFSCRKRVLRVSCPLVFSGLNALPSNHMGVLSDKSRMDGRLFVQYRRGTYPYIAHVVR